MQTIRATPPDPQPNTFFPPGTIPMGTNLVYGYLRIGKKVGLRRASSRLRDVKMSKEGDTKQEKGETKEL